jgi:hypothetical protein
MQLYLRIDFAKRKYRDRMTEYFEGTVNRYSELTAQKVDKLARKIFSEEKKKFMKEFRESPITKEIKDREVTYSNRMGIFPETSAEHRGNLRTLIGFESSEQSGINEVIRTLSKNCRLKVTKSKSGKKYHVYFPSEDKLRELTPYPWASNARPAGSSWMYDIEERGICGFTYYLYDKDRDFKNHSRSGRAIQTKKQLRTDGRADDTTEKTYFPTMYENFQNRVLNRFKAEIFDKIGRNGEFLEVGKYIIE